MIKTASESDSISSEASTSLPLSTPATVALAKPEPIEDARSSLEIAKQKNKSRFNIYKKTGIAEGR